MSQPGFFASKITSEHIDKLRELQRLESENAARQRQREFSLNVLKMTRLFWVFFIIVGLILASFAAFRSNPGLMEKIIQFVMTLAAGVLGGYGLAKTNKL